MMAPMVGVSSGYISSQLMGPQSQWAALGSRERLESHRRVLLRVGVIGGGLRGLGDVAGVSGRGSCGLG